MGMMEKRNLQEERIYEKARKKAKEIRGFYINLACYCVIIPTLFVINLIYFPGFFWVFFSALGWGLGLVFHYMEAFDKGYVIGQDWEDRKIAEILKEENVKTQINSQLKEDLKMDNYYNSEEAKYERAKKRVKAQSGFYKHLISYISINIFIILVKVFREGTDVLSQCDTYTVAFFWGIGLAFHAIGVFYKQAVFGRNWEERKIREIMEKDKRQKWE